MRTFKTKLYTLRKFNTIIFVMAIFLGSIAGFNNIYADGCYICGSGSSEKCKDYCKYSGSDNFENRKKCEKAGCKITGTSSCPKAANYKVCSAWNEDKPLFDKLYSYLK